MQLSPTNGKAGHVSGPGSQSGSVRGTHLPLRSIGRFLGDPEANNLAGSATVFQLPALLHVKAWYSRKGHYIFNGSRPAQH